MAQKKRVFGVLTVLCVGLILSFQNCSSGEYGLYGSRAPTGFFCHDEFVCFEDSDHLWVEGGAAFPIYPRASQNIAGDCNSGGFADNKIEYQVLRTLGTTELILATGETKCDPQGRYRFTANVCPGLSAANCNLMLTDSSYSFTVALKISAMDEFGGVHENLRYSGEVEFPLAVLKVSP